MRLILILRSGGAGLLGGVLLGEAIDGGDGGEADFSLHIMTVL